jgi:hypothetical protein
MLLSMLMLGATAGLLWENAAAFSRVAGIGASSRVYTVATLRADLRRDPVEWVGRTVRVRGVADYCLTWVSLDGSNTQNVCLAGHRGPGCRRALSQDGSYTRNVCTSLHTVLRDREDTGSATRLPLALEAENRLYATLRRVPFLRWITPAAQAPQWGLVSTYTVQVRAEPRIVCWNASPCVAAVLLDTDPSVPQ